MDYEQSLAPIPTNAFSGFPKPRKAAAVFFLTHCTSFSKKRFSTFIMSIVVDTIVPICTPVATVVECAPVVECVETIVTAPVITETVVCEPVVAVCEPVVEVPCAPVVVTTTECITTC